MRSFLAYRPLQMRSSFRVVYWQNAYFTSMKAINHVFIFQLSNESNSILSLTGTPKKSTGVV